MINLSLDWTSLYIYDLRKGKMSRNTVFPIRARLVLILSLSSMYLSALAATSGPYPTSSMTAVVYLTAVEGAYVL